MSLQPPAKNWHTVPLGKDERIWIYLIMLMILMMGTFTVGWVFMGNQNNPELYFQYDSPAELQTAFIAGNNDPAISVVSLSNGEQALARTTPGDIYMYAQRWQWTAQSDDGIYSALQFTKGVRYQLHLGSIDVLHGFQLIGQDFLITLQIVPGYDYVLDFTPNDTGLFRIICNEYCGSAGHDAMAGFLEVV